MNLPADFVFSQSSLQDYLDCARRFELRYLLHVSWPAVESEPMLLYEQHTRQGEDFHRLIHQHLIGIPEEAVSRQIVDETLKQWWANYRTHAPRSLPAEKHAEFTLSAPLGGYRLVAKLDLLAVDPGQQFVIVDWKTSLRKPDRQTLAKRVQTAVYRYLVVAAGAYLNGGQAVRPEQVEMIYWFVVEPNSPEHFGYDSTQFNAEHEKLLDVITEIDHRSGFALTEDRSKCLFCTYRSLCERGERAGDFTEMSPTEVETIQDLDFDLDQIAEIEF